MVHALESETENSRKFMFGEQKKLVQWKTGMKVVLVEWKFPL